ncbi:hypothetical protein BGZ94_000757 [Podila epigama]|nr:hypothetical protein BGZ94_000757 [Podila epigama]
MTLDQVLHQRQQTLLQEQIQLEKSQRLRQQQELQLQLARHRNKIQKMHQDQVRLQQQQQQQQQLMLQEEEKKQKNLAMTKGQGEDGKGEREREGEGGRAGRSAMEAKNVDDDGSTGTASEATLARTREKMAVEANPLTHGQRQETRSTKDIAENEQSSSSVATMAGVVDTRYRSMFGYRGPEHGTTTASEARKQASIMSTRIESALSSPPRRRISLLAAEDRVRLAMMDYSAKDIDRMTPAQAHDILNGRSSPSTSAGKFIRHHRVVFIVIVIVIVTINNKNNSILLFKRLGFLFKRP